MRHQRLLRRLESLPRVRGVGRVAVVLGEEGMPAFSAWFPRPRGGAAAWVVVPPAVLGDAEAFRLTVLHELQHPRQRDTHLAFARLVLTGAFFWHPAAHALSRWLVALQELACDEALVVGGRAPAQAYARCLLQAALTLPGAPPLPAGATGLSHPTARRIQMLFQPRPFRAHGASALLAALCRVLLPLATLAEAKALAESSQPSGDLPVVVDAKVVEQLNRLIGTEKGRAFMKRALAQGGSRDVSALVAAGRLNEYTATVQAGLLIVRNPHLLD